MTYVLREVSAPILPAGAGEIRVLHFSDLHLTPSRRQEIADIRSFAELKPDLVIATGDFMAHQDAVPTVLQALEPLFDIPGLFVFGSNDYFGPRIKNPFSYLRKDNGRRVLGPELPWQGLASSLEQLGWINLNHQKTLIEIKGVTIEARGTDDAHLEVDQEQDV